MTSGTDSIRLALGVILALLACAFPAAAHAAGAVLRPGDIALGVYDGNDFIVQRVDPVGLERVTIGSSIPAPAQGGIHDLLVDKALRVLVLGNFEIDRLEPGAYDPADPHHNQVKIAEFTGITGGFGFAQDGTLLVGVLGDLVRVNPFIPFDPAHPQANQTIVSGGIPLVPDAIADPHSTSVYTAGPQKVLRIEPSLYDPLDPSANQTLIAGLNIFGRTYVGLLPDGRLALAGDQGLVVDPSIPYDPNIQTNVSYEMSCVTFGASGLAVDASGHVLAIGNAASELRRVDISGYDPQNPCSNAPLLLAANAAMGENFQGVAVAPEPSLALGELGALGALALLGCRRASRPSGYHS